MKESVQKSFIILFFLIFSAHFISAQDVNPVKNLTGNCNNSGKVSLSWTKPDPLEVDGFWLTWSSDDILGTIGAGQDGEISSVARFAASDLTSKGVTAGDKIVQMQLVVGTEGCSQIDIKIWEGGSFLLIPIINLVIANPGTLKVEQRADLSLFGNNWTTIPLEQPHIINTTTELWMGFTATASASAYPLGYDHGPRTNNKSDLLYFSDQWSTLYLATQNEYSLNACIKAFVTQDDFLYVSKYEVYKDGVKLGETASTNYTVDGLLPGEYNFCVKAVYSNNAQSVEVCKVTVCDEVCNPVTNVNVSYSAVCDKATMVWTKPEAVFPLNYNIYRDGTFIDGPFAATTYIDVSFDNTVEHTWSIETVCPTTLSNKVNKTMPACYKCEPVSELVANFSEDCKAFFLQWTPPSVAFPVKYNIYRDGALIAEQFEETFYADEDFDNTIEHTWSVETVCSTLVSNKMDITKQCYLGINASISNVAIFPNPASETITIQVNSFHKVKIYNTVGQFIGTIEQPIVDVSSYNSGLYFFKVFDTDNNFAVRRVTVLK